MLLNADLNVDSFVGDIQLHHYSFHYPIVLCLEAKTGSDNVMMF